MTVPEPFFHELADASRAVVMPHFRTAMAVENKDLGHFDPVTVADRESERVMRALIAERYPDHGVLGEEFAPTALDADHVWVLDPIDGTRSFISGLPVWGTLIGLTEARRPVAGLMAQPFTGERFYGDVGGARYTGPGGPRPLAVRPCAEIAAATVFTTSPSVFSADDLARYRRVEDKARLFRYGCDCYAYAMVAAGHVDAVVEAGLKAFDIVALVPIIEAAGGIVTTWDGGDPADGGRIVACGDRRLHAVILDILNG